MVESRGAGSRLENLLSRVRTVATRLGWTHVFLWLCAALARRVSDTRIFVVLVHPFDSVPIPSEESSEVDARFLTADEVERCASDEDFRYSSAFATEALARGDRCFGVFSGHTLLCYCWYAAGAAPVFEDIEVAVVHPYVYGYNAYTDAAHRGKGLHRLGISAAKQAYRREGVRGFVAYIEADNLAPLTAAYRMGEERAGFVVFARLFGKLHWLATPGCREIGFTVHRRREPSPVPVSRLSPGQF
jgi:hypothetical protein